MTLCLSFLIYEKGTAAQPHKVAGIIKRVTRCKGVFGAVSTECHVCAVAFPGGTVVTNLPGSAGDARDAGSVPGLGRSLGVEMAICCSILVWKISWTEEAGGLQSMGS